MHSRAPTGCNGPNRITEDDVDVNLFTSQGFSPPLDILIRSSGVKRFSDFLLWQVRVCIRSLVAPH